MRVAVVGMGGVGAMAAWRLARSGHEVIALEQFRLDHDRGGSYGDSRIVRRVYTDALYTSMMADAYALWEELQAQFPGEELFRQAGGIFCGPADHPHLRLAEQALITSGVRYDLLNPEACARLFPAFPLAPNEIALYEPGMGYARASHCVRAAAILARRYGALIREETTVLAIERDGARYRIRIHSKESGSKDSSKENNSDENSSEKTEGEEDVYADRVLLSVGPWTGPLLTKLGLSASVSNSFFNSVFNSLERSLTVTRQAYVHLLPTRNAADFEVGRFPVWIDAATNFYGFPRLGDLPGVKISLHDQGAAVTPETVDREVREEDRNVLRAYAARRFPWLSAEVTYEKVCLYTNTPDEHFLIDAVPGIDQKMPGIFLIGGLSGHGFKFTPLLGQIAADLVTEKPVSCDLSRFRLNRFMQAD